MIRPVKVHLIDGTYELFRAYYGGPPAKSAAGVEVGATRTLLRSLLFLLRDPTVTHLACAYDHVIESFRNELFDGYKTSAGIEPELFAQFPLAEQASAALGIVTWPMVEFEADDALATAAALCASDERVEQVLICSPDKDLAQCVQAERVVLFDRMRNKLLAEPDVIAKFGVGPAAIPDYLALVGDDADGIPGIPGWGAKSAAQVLSAYGSIDGIPERADVWSARPRGADRLSASLNQRRDDARLYRRLALLRRDVPLGIGVDDLAWRGPELAPLESFAAAITDTSLVERVREVMQARGASFDAPAQSG